MDQNIDLPLDQLHESPFNYRKVFDEAALQELAADIKASGRVLQPLLVRPIVPPLLKGDENGIAGYEIVFGHRRARAAAIAGLASAPCMVRAMDDDEARRAQISENLSRKDVHAIEEAEGFQALIDNDNMTADLIAEQFGKSRSYVYGRLKLLQACLEIRKACLAGEIDAEVALLVARLRTLKLQEKALEYIRKEYRAKLDDGGKASFRTIRALLNEKFTLDLKSAMFDVDDEMLLPSAGYCGRCPKRSGNAPEYSDVAEPDMGKDRHGMRRDNVRHEGPDVCTDPDCFDAKKKAHLKREAAKLEAEGKVVVAGNAARAAISAHGEIKGAFVALKDVRASLKKLPKKGSAAGQEFEHPEIFTIQDPRTGKTHQAVKRAAVQAAGVEVKETKPKGGGYDHRSYEEERKQREAIAARKTAANMRLFHSVRAVLTQPGLPELQAVARALVELVGDSDDGQTLCEIWGMKHSTQIEHAIETLDASQLTRLVLDCVLLGGVNVPAYYGDREPENLLAAAVRCGIDVDAVRAEPAEGTSTPSAAARAPEETIAAPAADEALAKASSTKGKSKGRKQKDDAGDAGGSGAQVDTFDEAEA